MVGNPGETERSLMNTELFLKKYMPDFAIFAPVLPLPNTNINSDERIKELNIEKKLEEAVFSITPPRWPIYIPKGMTENEVLYWVNRLQKAQFLNPKYIIYRIFKLHSINEAWIYFKGFVALIKEIAKKKLIN